MPEESASGGLGFSSGNRTAGLGFGSKGGLGAGSSSFGSKGGLGSTHSQNLAEMFGLSSTGASTPATPSDDKPTPSVFPSAFGASREKSFVRDDHSSTPKPLALDAKERAHFNKLQGTFGARMLAKMGWEAGHGLGVSGTGIVTPIENKLRPQKMGIAFKGFKERTEQSKREARRRGEVVSDDEDVKGQKAKAKRKEKERSDVWKKPKKVKTRVEHKTYEEILEEAGELPPSSSLGQIIDATGAVPKEVSSLADVSINNWAPYNDLNRIPEVRHNVRLISDACKTDLDGLAREARALEERKKFAVSEDTRLRKKVADEAELIARLQKIQLVANDINAKSKELSSVYEVSLDPFSPLFYTLISEFSVEFEKYRLDEIVVAAIAPSVQRMAASWNPLKDPTAFISTFRIWSQALRVRTEEEKPPETQKPMSPFESLLWNVWLPRVRSAINNDWSPHDPQPVLKLYEAWCTFLPPFIRDNILDQLILPKVQKAIADWNPKRDHVSLQSILFPWLPHLGLRLEDALGDARRKVKSILRSWTVGDPVSDDLAAWRDVFDAKDWDLMMLKYVVPKLSATLRVDLRINPRDQKMETIERVLAWSKLIRLSVYTQMLEAEFFPKWLDVLHIWLIQPRVSFEEVAQWYRFWKDSFPENLQGLRGFTRGLDLMNEAIKLGSDAPLRLRRPDFRAEIAAAEATKVAAQIIGKQPARPSARVQEITFRAIVEEYAAENNLLFVPAGKAHELSRLPLYRVSRTADGKGGILVYVLDDAVWASPEGAGHENEMFKAITLEDMVTRANMAV
ncbi:TFP11-domain-containing protein [Fistulina hepatica ATCC 64428]|uniref:TFP11-domain-containing protein n=1 Tax=Fistulina hepatica ATCC 64428 TaxID=1128425 RepID=A0A0D7AKV5_9AGAR|nr:TFP11-domain-containing protein [Fistulina hepatica ATCC 64428]